MVPEIREPTLFDAIVCVIVTCLLTAVVGITITWLISLFLKAVAFVF